MINNDYLQFGAFISLNLKENPKTYLGCDGFIDDKLEGLNLLNSENDFTSCVFQVFPILEFTQASNYNKYKREI